MGLLAVCLLAAACGGRDGMSLLDAPDLSAEIAAVQRDGGSAALRDLTGGDWDQVRVFQEPVSRDFVERDLGVRVDMPEVFDERGHILAFRRGGAVTRVMVTTPANLTPGTYSASVVLTSPQPGAARLRLTDR